MIRRKQKYLVDQHACLVAHRDDQVARLQPCKFSGGNFQLKLVSHPIPAHQRDGGGREDFRRFVTPAQRNRELRRPARVLGVQAAFVAQYPVHRKMHRLADAGLPVR